jgi:hypothetical protein
MPRRCRVCNEDLERETGFYYGAMMISHATTTLIAVIVHAIVYAFYGWEVVISLISICSSILLLFPVVFRTSRAIWINFFVRYEPDPKKY